MKSLQQVLIGVSLWSSVIFVAVAQSSTATPPTTATGSALTQPTIPSCANLCVQTAAYTQSCAPGNQTCLCAVSTSIQNSISSCLKTSTCSDSDKTIAFEYYPQFCKSLNLAVATEIPTILATPSNTATAGPTSGTSSLSVDAQGGAAETGNPTSDKNLHAGLQLPAILGIVLAVVIMFLGVGVLMVWSFLQRRRVLRRPRMDLGGEFVDPKPRPPRSRSVNSEFMVQPSPIEKDTATFGADLSRSSTLVPPPPVAKDGKRSSEEKRNSARGKALKKLLGHDGLRSSLLSSRPGSKQPSLMVPPLDIRKSEESQLRVSKL